MKNAIPVEMQSSLSRTSSQLDSGQALAFEEDVRLIRHLIWLYLVLWLIEGGLRRWFLPSLATPLLLVRDPVVVIIYFLAWSRNLFPTNGFILTGAVLAFLALASALMVGHGNLIVALYGVRCDFLHVPLIFIMGRVLRQKDVLAVAKAAVWLVIPYTALLVAQFYQPQNAWVNRGLGDSLTGAGFFGAEDHYRPPGTFSFITGPAELYPLFAACWFVLLLARKLPAWLMIASGLAILIAIPVSISRLFFLSVVIVTLAGIAAMLLGGRFSIQTLIQVTLAAIIIPILASYIPAFKDGMAVFRSRWATSTTEAGGFQETIVDRVVDGLFGSFDQVGYLGLGTGFSTQVGQRLLKHQAGFGASEAEWGRLLCDNGFFLGSLLIGYRIALAGSIAWISLRAWRRRSPNSLIILSAGFLNLLNGQWGQATTLGAAVIAGGLALAAAADDNTTDESKPEM